MNSPFTSFTSQDFEAPGETNLISGINELNTPFLDPPIWQKNEFEEQETGEFEEQLAEHDEAGICAAPGFTAGTTPPLLDDKDSTVPGYTCYVKIDLGKGNRQMDMTGIYMPSSFNPKESFDLIIYLHGNLPGFPGAGFKINEYWKAVKPSHGDLRIREEVNVSGKNIILVAPSLGDYPNSHYNDLSRIDQTKNKVLVAGGLDSYVIKIIGAIQTYILLKRFNGGKVNLRHIILAAHSAGGNQMMNIATAENPLYGCLVSECWGFDSLYQGERGADIWKAWSQKNPTKKLFIYYLESTKENSCCLFNKAASVPNVFVKRSTAKHHSYVPIEHFRTRISKIGCDEKKDPPPKECQKYCKDKISKIDSEHWDERAFYKLYDPGRSVVNQGLAEEDFIDNENEYITDELSSDEISTEQEDYIPSSDLGSLPPYKGKHEWANTPENMAIRKKVYEAHLDNSKGKPYTYFLDKSVLKEVDNSGQSLLKEPAAWLEKLLIDARNFFEGKDIKINIISGYRTARYQFSKWVRSFPFYFYHAVHNGGKSKLDYKGIAQYMGLSLAAPGYSNHNHGLAVDFGVKEGSNEFAVNTNPADHHDNYWRRNSLFWKWLVENASRYHFYPYSVEPWHWEFKSDVAKEQEWHGLLEPTATAYDENLHASEDDANKTEDEGDFESNEDLENDEMLDDKTDDLKFYAETSDEESNNEEEIEQEGEYRLEGFSGTQYGDEVEYNNSTNEDFSHKEFDTDPRQGKIIYLNVSAVKDPSFSTGVFVPTGFCPSAKVDVLLYLHGQFDTDDYKNGIKDYWGTYSDLRLHFYLSQRNAILIVPSIGKDPQRHTSAAKDSRSPHILLKDDSGFDNFILACFKELVSRGDLAPGAAPSRIILAAHSAGGSPLSGILNVKNKLLANVMECWGFDCAYGYSFDKWLNGNPAKKFYHYWAFNCSATHLRNCPRVIGDRLAKQYPDNFKNISPGEKISHRKIIEHAWINEINIRSWFDLVASGCESVSNERDEYDVHDIETEDEDGIHLWEPFTETDDEFLRQKTSIQQNIVSIAKKEIDVWKGKPESKMFDSIKTYWKDGVRYNDAEARKSVRNNEEWSAAFISFVMRKATNNIFHPSSAHNRYTVWAKENETKRPNIPFRIFKINEVTIEVGDIIVNAREVKGRALADFDSIINKDAGRKAHGDVVIEIDSVGNTATVAGGNKGFPGVKTVQLLLTSDGKVLQKQTAFKHKHGSFGKYIAVVKLMPDVPDGLKLSSLDKALEEEGMEYARYDENEYSDNDENSSVYKNEAGNERLFSYDQPTTLIDAMESSTKQALEQLLVVTIKSKVTNNDQLAAIENLYTNIFFNLKHPELRGRKLLDSDPRSLQQEWKEIKLKTIRPLVNKALDMVPDAYSTDKIPPGFKIGKDGAYEGLTRHSSETVSAAATRLGKAGLLSSAGISNDDVDLFQRIANAESYGSVQNFYSQDDAIISMGFRQFVFIHGDHDIIKWINKVPAAFKKYGIEIDTFSPAYKIVQDGKSYPESKIKGAVNYDDLRYNGWAQRFYYAGLDDEIIIAGFQLGKEYFQNELKALKTSLSSFPGQFEKFMNFYNQSGHLRALFHELSNDSPKRAREITADAMENIRDSDMLIEDFMKAYKLSVLSRFKKLDKPQNKNPKKFEEKANRIIDNTSKGSQLKAFW